MKRLSILFLFVIYCSTMYSQKVSISLFNTYQSQTFVLTPVSGKYNIIAGDTIIPLSLNQIIYVSRSGDSVKVRDMINHYGTWSRVSVVGQTDNDVLRINSVVPSLPARLYDDNLSFYVDFDRLMTLNIIDMDKYIAGVVEAEAGPNAHAEFYKAQALLARTYAIGHAGKHNGEGFNLCDDVHCQAYKGKLSKSETILKAVRATTGLVVVDEQDELIVGAFHANCGGHTANSGDVWVTNHPYLTSVADSYCKSQPNSQWEVRIPIDSFNQFLTSKGVATEGLTAADYALVSQDRTYEYRIGGKVIPTSQIRSHFNLRSAYFSIDMITGFIRVKGKGYGHGVGLCQDGGMQMAKKGKTYSEIINYYFKGVKIVDYYETSHPELFQEEVEPDFESDFEEDFSTVPDIENQGQRFQ